MPKTAPELSAAHIQRIQRRGLHNVGGVVGLGLYVTRTGTRSWVLRAVVGSKRRDIGLGSYPSVSLAEARERAREARKLIWQGTDPVEERAARQRALVQSQRIPTFAECARSFVAAKRPEFRNAKHTAQWASTLEQYAGPHFGTLPVDRVELRHVLEALQSIWPTKTETASRLRGRIEAVLAWATVAGYRSGDNPARWRGNLDAVLPKPGKVRRVEHMPALPYADLPAFLQRLRIQEGLAARAVEFAILTAARSGEVRGAMWNEIDLDAATWTIPAERMKAGKEHRVPLSASSLKLLRGLTRMGAYVFPAPRGGRFSDNSLSAVLRRMQVAATVHGFRSTFRDWAGETTAFPREVIEHALAHRLKDKAEAAYQRGTLFDKRRKLMDAWAAYCAPPKAQSAKVTPIRA